MADDRSEHGGRRLGPYRLIGELGRGGMGVVHRARRDDLQRDYALKVILAGRDASPEAIERFRREAQAAAALADHPGIVGVHDIGEADGHVFFAMDLVEGLSLEAVIDRGDLVPRQAADIIAQAARALHHAHVRGILHRDLKPANVLVGHDGLVRLADFGLAVQRSVDAAAARLTQSGQLVGTPAYMAPEQVRGEPLDVRADVYALGATLYEALVLAPPFPGTTVAELLGQVLRDDPIPPRRKDPRLPAELETVVLKCLEKDPAQRYHSADALADDLDRWLRDEPVLARRPTLPERIRRWRRRHPAATTVLLAATTLGLGYFAGPGWVQTRTPGGTTTEWRWPAGRHTVRFSGDGWQPQSSEVLVQPWRTATWDPPRLADHGFVQASTTPPGARLTLEPADGAPLTMVADGSAIRVPVGVYGARLEQPGFHPVTDVVRVGAATTVRLERALQPLLRPVRLSAYPSDAVTRLRRVADAPSPAPWRSLRLPAPPIELPGGRYEVELRAPGFESRRFTTDIASAAPPTSEMLFRHFSLAKRERWRHAAGNLVTANLHVLDDRNGDGWKDLLWTEWDRMRLLDGRDGVALWPTPAPTDAEEIVCARDLDGDGRHEFIARRRDGGISAISTDDGLPLWERTFEAAPARTVAVLALPTDIDGDAIPDVLIGLQGEALVLSARTGAVVWRKRLTENAAARVEWIAAGASEGGAPPIALATLKLTMASNVFALDPRDGSVRWADGWKRTTRSRTVAGRFDDRPGLDLALLEDRRVRVLRGHDGSTLWHHPHTLERSFELVAGWGPVPGRDGVVTNGFGIPPLRFLDGAQPPQRLPFGRCRRMLPGPVRPGGRRSWVVAHTDAVEAWIEGASSPAARCEFTAESLRLCWAGDLDGDSWPDAVVVSDGKLVALSFAPPRGRWTVPGYWVGDRPRLTGDADGDAIPEPVLRGPNGVARLRSSDGTPIWTRAVGPVHRPIVAAARTPSGLTEQLFVRVDDGRYVYLDAATGRELWTWTTPDDHPDLREIAVAPGSPRVVGCLCTSGDGGVLTAHSAADGTELWRRPLRQGRAAVRRLLLCGADDRLGFLVITGRHAQVLHTRTGERLTELHLEGLGANAVVLDGAERGARALLVSGGSKGLHAVPIFGGGTAWSVAAQLRRPAPVRADLNGDGVDDLLSVREGKDLVAHSGADGRRLWRQRLRHTVGAPHAVTDLNGDGVAEILLPDLDTDGTLALDGRTGRLLGARVDANLWICSKEHAFAGLWGHGVSLQRPELPQPSLHALAAMGMWTELRARAHAALAAGPAAPDRARLLHWRGVAALRDGDAGAAVKDLDAAVAAGLRRAACIADGIEARVAAGRAAETDLAALPAEAALALRLRASMTRAHRAALRDRARAVEPRTPAAALLSEQPEECLALLQDFDPHDWRALAIRGAALADLGRQAECREALGIALRLNPLSEMLSRLREQLLEQR